MTPYQQYRFSFGYGLTPVIKKLLIIMAAVFFLQTLVSHQITIYLGLVPYLVWTHYFVWQLFTYIFLHGGLSHLLFNLLALWMFGGELENTWGSRRFTQYFFLCGIGAGICTVLFTPRLYQGIPVIGGSGAIYGLLLAFGWLFPNRLIYIYFLFPIPAKYFVIIFGLIEFFSSIGGRSGGGVAHLTHLGGLLFGLIYLGVPRIRQRLRREAYKRKMSQKGPGNRPGSGYYS
jgi:membrane associated rhomboid family serine protease